MCILMCAFIQDGRYFRLRKFLAWRAMVRVTKVSDSPVNRDAEPYTPKRIGSPEDGTQQRDLKCSFGPYDRQTQIQLKIFSQIALGSCSCRSLQPLNV